MATKLSEPLVPVVTMRPPDFGTHVQRSEIVRAKWWVAYPVAMILLILLDVALSYWRPFPLRLPEQFSPAYLNLYVTDVPKGKPVVAFLGDSVLWGYKLPAEETAAASLAHKFSGEQTLNLSYEGGSMPNSEVMLRYLLARGVRPAGVIVNVNVKEFNAADSAYKTLHPSLELAAGSILADTDHRVLTMHQAKDLNARLSHAIEHIWRLYRLRADLRERIFGTDDMSTAALNIVESVTGAAREKALEHRPTPDKFLGTYDLTPIDNTNVGMLYYRSLIETLCTHQIPALIFLTPTNHDLLHEYIDVPDYVANLKRLMNVQHCSSVRIVNYDRLIPGSHFLDNDHLDSAGQQILSRKLQPFLESVAK